MRQIRYHIRREEVCGGADAKDFGRWDSDASKYCLVPHWLCGWIMTNLVATRCRLYAGKEGLHMHNVHEVHLDEIRVSCIMVVYFFLAVRDFLS